MRHLKCAGLCPEGKGKQWYTAIQSDRYDVRTALVTFSNIVDIILYVQVITMLTRNMAF